MMNAGATSRWAAAWPALAVMGLTFVAFLPALRADFVIWDDDVNLTDNPRYRGLGREQLAWMWSTYHGGHYHPLTWMSFGLDYVLWGMNPLGYHLTNLVLHTLSAGVFYLLAMRLLCATGASFDRVGRPDENRCPAPEGAGHPLLEGQAGRLRPRMGDPSRAGEPQHTMGVAAGMAALFFAIHPLRVESVAWATERRDVLSGLFYLVSLWGYVRMAESPRRRGWWLAASLAACGLSLLSKAWAVTLPAVLLILDVYPLRRVRSEWRRVLVEKVLFLIPVVPTLILAGSAQWLSGAAAGLDKVGIPVRVFTAAYGLFFYIRKTLIPTGLAALYPMPAALNPWEPRFIGVVAFLVVAGTLVIWNIRRRPWLAAATACYVAIVSPVLGLYQSGEQLAADRYSYLSCMPWAILVGAGVAAMAGSRIPRIVPTAGCVALAAVLGALTWRQTLVWGNTESLWKQVIRTDPTCWVAYNNLGIHIAGRGDEEAAMELFRTALRLNPSSADAHNNLAAALAKRRDWPGAAEHHRAALSVHPKSAAAHNGLGDALLHLGNSEAALNHFQEAVRLQPDYLDARYNLALVLARAGRSDEAEQVLRDGLRFDENHVHSLRLLGSLLLKRKASGEAEPYYRRLTGMRSASWSDWFSLGEALMWSGHESEAHQAFGRAVRLDEAGEGAYKRLGILMARLKRHAQAVGAFRSGLARQGDDPDIQNSLAWLLATCPEASVRDGTEAVRLGEAVQRALGTDNPRVLDTLAAAYAEAGRFAEAVATAERALAAVPPGQHEGLAGEIRQRLALYRQGRPFRDDSAEK